MARRSIGHILTGIACLLVCAAAVQSETQSPAAAYLAANNGQFMQLLGAVGVDSNALQAMNGVLLVPSNAAVEEFARSMGMTLEQLLQNKLLVDQITAYHFLPRIKVTKGFKPPNLPLITKAAEPHYVVRFYRDSKTTKAWLQDMQGNKVPLKQQPVVFGNLTVVPADKVLMSGSYFRSFEDALRLHAQLTKANELFKKAGVSVAQQTKEATLFVPVDKAFDNSKVSVAALSQSDSRRVAAYHATQAALPVGKLQSASVPTLLSGHSVKVDVAYNGELKAPWSGKAVKKPVVRVTDEAGNKAEATLFNVWAGQGVIHGINKVLQPRVPAATSTQQAVVAATPQGSKPGSRRLLQTPDWSQSNPATALLAENTVAAAYAADQQYQNAYSALPDSPGWAPMNQWSCWECNA